MEWSFLFFFNSIFLGVALAMDAFSVSVANALSESHMPKPRMCMIAGTFAGFQFLMPMAGWVCVHTLISIFRIIEVLVPWIALVLLLCIGGMMILASLKGGGEGETAEVSVGGLMLQGIATSIDALSVGLTIASYDFSMAVTCSAIIALVTFAICIFGLALGKTIGRRISGKAEILGGCILIIIGIEIFVTGVFF
ncbi:MAG: manganese efflux pump MntP family protein [Clostridia bacterium]|nr:manganese efflux pump MntP family protein [Clostridia bacterium]